MVEETTYEFSDFRIDLREGLLLRGGQPVSIQAKTFELLCALIRRRGRVVTRDELMDELWADEKLKLEPIPVSDELFGKELNGEAIRTVKCRRLIKDGERVRVEPEYRTVPPALEGIRYKGRWVVIYSKYDVGCALEKHASPECLGHDYASAVKLARAAVLYALKR